MRERLGRTERVGGLGEPSFRIVGIAADVPARVGERGQQPAGRVLGPERLAG